MEKRFDSLTITEFQQRFGSSIDCLAYLAEQKWARGYGCFRCGHANYCDGEPTYSRQCTSCRYTETPTANTLFHKVKFDISKAFWIVYFVSTNKKGITSTELARKLGMRQKTAYNFKRKVMKAMESSRGHLMAGSVEVDEIVVGGQEEGVTGRKNEKKKLVVVGIEKKKKGVARVYARVIERADAKSLGGFMKDHIDPAARVTTDKWKGYGPLKKVFENLEQKASGRKGRNFPEMHRVVMNLKGWLRGMHHHVEHLQEYLNEYTYRFNRARMKKGIFDNLLDRMVAHPPCYIRNLNN